MSLMLMQQGYVHSYPTPPGAVLADVWRWDGNSGTVAVVGGWPLPPGRLTSGDLNLVVVRDETLAEVPCSVVALRGAYPDGTLRSIGIRFDIDLVNEVPRQFSIITGAEARTQDLGPWDEILYDSGDLLQPGTQNRATFIPADLPYWHSTFAALVPTQPEADDEADTMATFFKTTGTTSQTLSAWATYLHNQDGDVATGVSTYEFMHGFFVAAMRSSNAARRRWFYQRFYECLRLHMATYASPSYTEDGIGTVWSRVGQGADPTLPLGGDSGLPAEWNSVTGMSFAVGYLSTAWKQPWRVLSYFTSWTWGGATETSAMNRYVGATNTYSPRFNMISHMFRLPAYVVQATMQVKAGVDGYGTGRDNDAASWINDMAWTMKALETYKYTTANSAAYLDGIVGQRPTVDIGQGPGSFPTFQLMVVGRSLHFYYNNIANDSRIPQWIESIANMLITQMRLHANGTVYVMTYWHRANPDAYTLEWYYSSFFTEIFAFAYALTGNTLYRTWALRCGAPSQLAGFIPTYKALGEYFGGHLQAAKFYVDGGSVRPIPGAHPIAVTELPTHSS